MKENKQIRFSMGNLGDTIDKRSAGVQKKSHKKRTEINFPIFIESRN